MIEPKLRKKISKTSLLKEVPLGASPVKKAHFLKKLNYMRSNGIVVGRDALFQANNAHIASKQLMDRLAGDPGNAREKKDKKRSFVLDRDN